MADLIPVAAMACFGVACLLSFLRHAYHPAQMPLRTDPPPGQRHAFLGSITAMLATGTVMLIWWALLDFP